jgi:hypothetical protein
MWFQAFTMIHVILKVAGFSSKERYRYCWKIQKPSVLQGHTCFIPRLFISMYTTLSRHNSDTRATVKYKNFEKDICSTFHIGTVSRQILSEIGSLMAPLVYYSSHTRRHSHNKQGTYTVRYNRCHSNCSVNTQNCRMWIHDWAGCTAGQ